MSAEESEEGQTEGADLPWASLPFPPQSIVDSGTSNLIFTPDIFNLTVAELHRHQPQPDAVWQGEECIHHSEDGTDITDAWPTLTLVLAGEANGPPFALHIPPCRYLAKAPAKECKDGVAGHAFAIEWEQDEGVILGQVVYESFYVVHDNERNRVGFGKLEGCDSDVECLKEVRVERDDVLVRAKVVKGEVEGVLWVEERDGVGEQGEGMVVLEGGAIGGEGVGFEGRVEEGGQAVAQWRWGWLCVGLVLLAAWWWGWRRVMRKGREEDYAAIDSEDEVEVTFAHR